ncbi:hypothetical protein E4U58_007176 [Claviceps cyperi]|nr:hypothetical protein E4U58_007176 [Claviceps cyperi]
MFLAKAKMLDSLSATPGLRLLMRWGCKEKVTFRRRDLVDSEIVRPPISTAGHELVSTEIVSYPSSCKRLDPE